jgi:hypothetical protein
MNNEHTMLVFNERNNRMSGLIKDNNSLALIKEKCEEKLNAYFPAGVPDFVRERYEQELQYIEECDGAEALRLYYEFSVIAKEHNSLIASCGMGHNLFIRFLLGNTPIDPLAAYRYCPNCGYAEQVRDVAFGIDAPAKNCPVCGESLLARGYSLYPVFVWGGSTEKMPYDADDDDYQCPTSLYSLFAERIKELYINNQVVPWLSSINDGEEKARRAGFWILPKGKDLQKDFPQFVVHDENGSTCADGWHNEISDHGIQVIYLCSSQLLDKIERVQGNTDGNCIETIEEKIANVTATELIKTGLLEEDEVAALQAMPVTTRFQLTESLAVARNSFGNLGNAPWKERPYSLDTNNSFYTRETLYERLLKLGLTEIESYKVATFVRKGKAASKFGRQKWEQMVNAYSFPKEFVDCCQKFKYLYRRGDVLDRLRILAICVR